MSAPLTTAGEVEERIGRDLTVAETAMVEALIDEASSLAEVIAGAPIAVADYEAEVHDGRGECLFPRRYVLPQGGVDPVLTVDEIRVDGVAVDADLYRVKVAVGLIVHLAGCWPRGVCNIEIDYSAGFDPVPAWVTGLVTGSVARALTMPASDGIASEQWGDHTIGFMSSGTGSTGRIAGFTKIEEARLAGLQAPGIA